MTTMEVPEIAKILNSPTSRQDDKKLNNKHFIYMLLRKKAFQISLIAIVFFAGSLFAINTVLAEDHPNPNADNLIVEFIPDPLFNASNFLPGDSKIGKAKVINNTLESKRIATETINYSTTFILEDVPDDDLSRALLIIIRKKSGNDIYGGSSLTGPKTLFEFYKNGETYLSDVPSGETEEYEFEISFPKSMGNKWQGMITKFDIIVGFQDEDGQILAGEKLPQGLIIKDIKAYDITKNSAKVKWWTSYNATSQVVYCKTKDKKCSLDLNDNTDTPPLYGYKYTTGEEHSPANENGVTYREITITGLNKNTTYYFRCISHASPPTVSRGYSFTTLANDNENNDEDYNASGSILTSEEKNQNNKTNDDENSENTGLISDINKAFNSANNFIGSVLELGGANEIGKSAININNEQENKVKDSFKGSQNQTLLSMILLLLIIIILLYFILRFSKKMEHKIDDRT